MRVIDSQDEFRAFFKPKNPEQPEIHGGFAISHFSGEPELEAKIKDELGVTVRCIPLKGQIEGADPANPGTCPFTGKPSKQRVVWAKAY